jgi:hypothetical protein
VVARGEVTLPDTSSGYDDYLEQRLSVLDAARIDECPSHLPPASAAGALSASATGAPQTRWAALQEQWRAVLSRPCR